MHDVIISFATGVSNIVMTVSVCLFVVCLFICPFAYVRHVARPNVAKFSVFSLPVAVVRSSSGTFAIRYVFLVLLMTSYFYRMGPMTRNVYL